VKDAAQAVAQDVAQDLLGAAENGGVPLLIVYRVIFQRQNTRPTDPPLCPWATRKGRARKGRGASRGAGRGRGRVRRRGERELGGVNRGVYRHLPAAELMPCTRVPPPTLLLGGT